MTTKTFWFLFLFLLFFFHTIFNIFLIWNKVENKLKNIFYVYFHSQKDICKRKGLQKKVISY